MILIVWKSSLDEIEYAREILPDSNISGTPYSVSIDGNEVEICGVFSEIVNVERTNSPFEFVVEM